MATTHRHPVLDAADVVVEPQVVKSSAARKALAVLRIGFGFTFLWAFFDKLLALGFSTGKNPETGAVDYFGDAAWTNGGDPTAGFLGFGTSGPFADFYQGLVGDWWVTPLFMIGLLGIGTALTLGIGMRIAAASGALLYLFMWTAALWPANNPFLDDHILGAVTLVVLALTLAGDTWGFGKQWARTHLVRRYGVLR